MSEPDLMKDVILSPEGVEEKVIEQRSFEICLTGGGKFRVYYNEKGVTKRQTVGIFDEISKARERLGYIMNMQGAMIVRPDETIKMILKSVLGDDTP